MEACYFVYPKSYLLIDGYLSTGFWIVFIAVLLIEMNAIFGKCLTGNKICQVEV